MVYRRPTIIGGVFVLSGFYIFFGSGLSMSPFLLTVVVLLLIAGAVGIFKGFLSLKTKRRLQASADAPWKVRPDWASGVIRNPIFSRTLVAWSLAIGAIVGTAMLTHLISADGALEPGSKLFLGLVHLLALVLLVSAGFFTYRLLRFGVSECTMLDNPGVLGGQLSAVIYTGKRIVEPGSFTVKVEAVHEYIVGSGKHAQTHRRVLWSGLKHTREAGDTGTFRKNAIPVDFDLPFDLPASSTTNPRDRYRWLLSVKRALPGLDYRARFEIPVFQTEASNPAQTEEALEAAQSGADGLAQAPNGGCLTEEQREVLTTCGIDVMEDRAAHLMLAFRGSGNWKRVIPGFVFGSVCLAASIAIYELGLPWIVFLGTFLAGVSGLLLSCYLLLARLQLNVTCDQLELKRHRLIFESRVSLLPNEVNKVDDCEPYVLKGVPFFRLQAHCENRRRPLKLLPALSDRAIIRRIGRRIEAILKRSAVEKVPAG